MRQILDTWAALDLQKKVVAVLAAIAVLVTFVGLTRLASSPKMALLYSGLDPASSSEIVTSLEQKTVAFEIRGDAIYVDTNARDVVRMSLAGEGLPSSGIAGYELLDTLSGFGTTSQMFDAAYWRAKEGELARTILGSVRITMARVHIANPVSKPFERGVEPSASVTVTSKNGALDATQAQAIRHLVASAVAGLAPEQVAVIDTEYGIILQPGATGSILRGESELDARAGELRANVERLLSARVGAGNAIVEVMVEASSQSETVTERILDPEAAVAVSSDSSSNTQSSSGGGGAGGAVTVASNLPDTENQVDGSHSSNSNESRERVNYEVSETLRERVNLPGDISRLTVAVLVNHEVVTLPSGEKSVTPRSAAELEAFRALVQSAVGFNESRGDVVTIESMAFPQTGALGSVATQGMFSTLFVNIPLILQMLFLALIALALGLFVVKPILTNPAPQLNALPDDLPLPEPDDVFDNNLFDSGFMPAVADIPALDPPASNNPVDILRETIAKRSEESNQLLRSWIESKPEDTTEQSS